MEICLSGDWLVMIVETGAQAAADARAASSPDPELWAWDQLMDAFQKPVAAQATGEKWTAAERILTSTATSKPGGDHPAGW